MASVIEKDDEISFVLGIDIGSTKVCALLAKTVENNGRKTLEIMGLGKIPCEGVKSGSIKNLQKTRESIKKALDEAAQQAGIRYNNMSSLLANVNIGGDYFEARNETNFITRRTGGTEIKEEDIQELYKDVYRSAFSDSHETIHVLPLEFMIDNEANVFQPVGRIGRKIGGDFKLIKAQKTSLDYVRDSLKGAFSGLRQDSFVLSPLAAGLSALSAEQKRMGVALVDIGGGTTDLAIYKDGALRHVAILPFGGNHITNDIKEFAGISREKAEDLKKMVRETDDSLYNNGMMIEIINTDGVPNTDVVIKNVVLIIKSRLREIAAQVNAEIKYANFEGRLPVGIVLTGGSTKINGIDRIFKEITGQHVQIGKPRDLQMTGLYETVANDGSYATALGLAWSAIKPLDDRLVATPKDEIEAPQTPTKEEKKGGKKIFDWAKSFLKDDIGNSDSYE